MERKWNTHYWDTVSQLWKLDTGFLAYNVQKAAILNFKPVNERICGLRMTAHFFNISFTCTLHQCRANRKIYLVLAIGKGISPGDKECKTAMGDLNTKVEREMTLHQVSKDIGIRLIDFAIGNNMIITSR